MIEKIQFRVQQPRNPHFTPTLQKARMLQIQGARGCCCSVLPQTLGNEGYAVCSAFPQGKKHANFIKILEFTWDRFQILKSNLSEDVRLLSFMLSWHVFMQLWGLYRYYTGELSGLIFIVSLINNPCNFL